MRREKLKQMEEERRKEAEEDEMYAETVKRKKLQEEEDDAKRIKEEMSAEAERELEKARIKREETETKKAEAEKKKIEMEEKKKEEKKKEEAAKKKVEVEAKQKAEAESKKKADAEAKKKAKVEANKKAEAEAKKKAEAEEKLKAEAEEKQKKEDADKKKVEAEKKKAEAAEKKKEETEQKRQEDEKKQAQEEEKKKALAEKKKAEAEQKKSEAQKKKAEEEEKKRAEEEKKKTVADKKKADAEEKKKIEAEKKKAEADKKKAEAEVEEKRKAESEKKKAEAEEKKKALTDKKKLEAEEKKKREEDEKKKLEAEEKGKKEKAEKKKEEAEEKRKAAKQAEAERKKAEKDATKAAEAEEKRKKEEAVAEKARKKAEAEAKRTEIVEAQKKLQEEKKRAAEEAKRAEMDEKQRKDSKGDIAPSQAVDEMEQPTVSRRTKSKDKKEGNTFDSEVTSKEQPELRASGNSKIPSQDGSVAEGQQKPLKRTKSRGERSAGEQDFTITQSEENITSQSDDKPAPPRRPKSGNRSSIDEQQKNRIPDIPKQATLKTKANFKGGDSDLSGQQANSKARTTSTDRGVTKGAEVIVDSKVPPHVPKKGRSKSYLKGEEVADDPPPRSKSREDGNTTTMQGLQQEDILCSQGRDGASEGTHPSRMESSEAAPVPARQSRSTSRKKHPEPTVVGEESSIQKAGSGMKVLKSAKDLGQKLAGTSRSQSGGGGDKTGDNLKSGGVSKELDASSMESSQAAPVPARQSRSTGKKKQPELEVGVEVSGTEKAGSGMKLLKSAKDLGQKLAGTSRSPSGGGGDQSGDNLKTGDKSRRRTSPGEGAARSASGGRNINVGTLELAVDDEARGSSSENPPAKKPARKSKGAESPVAEDMSISRERAMDEAASTIEKLPAKAAPARKAKADASGRQADSKARTTSTDRGVTKTEDAEIPPQKPKKSRSKSSNLASGDEGRTGSSSGSLDRKSTSGNQTSGSEENVDRPGRKKRSDESRLTTGILKKPIQSEQEERDLVSKKDQLTAGIRSKESDVTQVDADIMAAISDAAGRTDPAQQQEQRDLGGNSIA